MGKSNHFSGQPIAEQYHLASVNFYRTAIKKIRLFYHLGADFTRHKCRRGELLYFYPQSGIISSECGIFALDRSNAYTRGVARCYATVYHLHSAEDIVGYEHITIEVSLVDKRTELCSCSYGTRCLGHASAHNLHAECASQCYHLVSLAHTGALHEFDVDTIVVVL